MAFLTHENNGVIWTSAPSLGTVCAFSTRLGGVSTGCAAGLDLGESTGGDPAAIRENWRLFAAAAGFDCQRLVFSKQVHQAAVRTVTSADIHTPCTPTPWEADALVTNEPGLSLCIVWADCVPILLHDPVKKVVAAAHSGWRGTAKNIAGETVSAMTERFGCDAKDIRAAVGPCICRECYEVGREVAEAFAALPIDASPFISNENGRLTADLRGTVSALLVSAGLLPENICVSRDCTCHDADRYWSHRRLGSKRGLQAAVIALPNV